MRECIARLPWMRVARPEGNCAQSPSKRASRTAKLGAICVGLACAVYPYPPEDAREREGDAETVSVRYSQSRECAPEGSSVPSVHADVAVVVVTYNSASDILPLIDDLRVAALDAAATRHCRGQPVIRRHRRRSPGTHGCQVDRVKGEPRLRGRYQRRAAAYRPMRRRADSQS